MIMIFIITFLPIVLFRILLEGPSQIWYQRQILLNANITVPIHVPFNNRVWIIVNLMQIGIKEYTMFDEQLISLHT